VTTHDVELTVLLSLDGEEGEVSDVFVVGVCGVEGWIGGRGRNVTDGVPRKTQSKP